MPTDDQSTTGQSNAATSVTTPRVGSGFTNISRYLQATQPTQFGQQVAGQITGLGQQATQTLQQQQQQFGAQLGQAQQQLGQNIAQGTQLIGQAGDIGSAASGFEPQVGQFQSFIGGAYQGPQGLQDSTRALAQARLAQQAGQYAGQTGIGGKAQLLQTFYGRPTYTTGQQSLDALLLSQGQAAQALRQAGQTTRGLETTAQTGIDVAQQQAQAQQQADVAARQQMRGQLESTYQTGMTEAQTEQQQAQQTAQQQLADLQSRIASGSLTQADIATLGLQKGQMYSTAGANIAGAVGLNVASLQDIAQTTSPETAAKLIGLARLAGTVDPTVQAGQFDLSKAGTYKAVQAGDVAGALKNVQAVYAANQARASNIKQQIDANNSAALARQRAIADIVGNARASTIASTLTTTGTLPPQLMMGFSAADQQKIQQLAGEMAQISQQNTDLTRQFSSLYGQASYA